VAQWKLLDPSAAALLMPSLDMVRR